MVRLRAWDFGFWDLGFRDFGFGFRAWDFGFWVIPWKSMLSYSPLSIEFEPVMPVFLPKRLQVPCRIQVLGHGNGRFEVAAAPFMESKLPGQQRP